MARIEPLHRSAQILPALIPLLLPSSMQGTTEVVLAASEKLGGCAIGDLDPSREGPEIAAVSGSGKFLVAHRRAGSWRSQQVFRSPGEMIQCVIGDADLEHEGLELVAVGMAEGPEVDSGPGAAYVVALQAGDWVATRIFDSEALLHAVCVDSGSVFVAGYDEQLTRVQREASGWTAEVIGALPGAGKSAAVALGGIVVACTDGSVVLFKEGDGGWVRSRLDHRESARSRIGVNGDRIVVADDDGMLSVLDGKTRISVFQDTTRLRGAALADLDPSRPGLEVATAGYSRHVTIVAPAEDWLTSPAAITTPTNTERYHPFIDSDRIHHLTAGDLDGDGDIEIVVCGYSGLLVAINPR